MIRNLVGAVVVGVTCCGVAAADEFHAALHKVEDGKITFRRREKPKAGEKRAPLRREEETLSVTSDIKVLKGKLNTRESPTTVDADGELPGGLKNAGLKNFDRFTPPYARIITDDKSGKIKEVWVFFPPPRQTR